MARCNLPVWNWGGYPESGRAIHRAEDLAGDSCATFKVKFQRSGAVTDVVTTWKLALFIACLVSLSCQRQSAEKELAPFRIVATDAGFEAPAGLAAGMRHVIFENHGSEIHEAMLVKLPKGMSPEAYVAAVKKGSLFPEGALDYSGAGLTSPGKTAEMWLKVDPGQYIIICWNDSHATKTPVHPFTVEETGLADDRPPKEDVVLRLFDYRFELDGDLHTGTQVIRVETPGPSMHEIDIYRLHDGKTLAELKSWRKQKEAGPARRGRAGRRAR